MIRKRIYQSRGRGGREFHKARWILVNPDTIIENACLEIENGKIVDIHRNLTGKNVFDHGPGVIMPTLVNAHLHLELSALEGCLDYDKGFKNWVKDLLEKRETLSSENMVMAAKRAVTALVNSGVCWVGDISSLDIVMPITESLGLNGIFFKEYLGTQLPAFEPVKTGVVSLSLAGHAPHTTSPELLKTLKQHTTDHGLVFSIHVAESDEETEFIRDRKGEWADFLTSRDIDWLSWDINSKTPVSHLHDLGVLDPNTIAVHLLNVSDEDILILAQTGVKVCICPRSNENLHKKLPDIEKMLKAGIEPALGTDSLASCSSLDIFDEMAFIRKKYPGLDPVTILTMGTVNGAKALGVWAMAGSLDKGKSADFLYNSVEAVTKKDLVEKIISNE